MGQLIRSRGRVWLAAASAVALAVVLFNVASPGQRAAGDTPGREGESTVRSESSAHAATHQAPPLVAAAAGDDGDVGADLEAEEPPPGAAPVAYPVDLVALRAKTPNNLYWKLGAPTEDAEVLSWREEEEARMNDLFGKVQSSTASEEEIHRYYDRRRKISEDYIEFATLALDDYGQELPEDDRGLYALSIKMHRSRLEALPREIDDALARKKAHDDRRDRRRQGEARP